MKKFLILLILLIGPEASASAYLGAHYGYATYGSDAVDEYKLSQKGPGYGAFFGVGKDFVGLEGFYQNFTTSGKVKHDGGKHDFTTNASALGAALRFSFNVFYARLGFGQYNLDQKIDINDRSSQSAANEIYGVEKGKKNGVLLGVGLHRRLGSKAVTFIDYSRHQITGAGNYDALSVGISFILPDRLFGFGKL